ncbi:MAG TPA: PspC family transcriptional regulator, partial [Cutibacterium acnes]|nr:PspC family transcriptional regulator [Cutibacterium acnes]
LADRTRSPHKPEGTQGSSAPFDPYKD